MSNLIIEADSGVGVSFCIRERPTKPANRPGAVVCLQQDVRIVKSVRDIEQFFRDFLSTGELTPSSMKQPQSSQGRR